MSGRIRTFKPELLDHDRYAKLTDAAARLFHGVVLNADDLGNCPAGASWIAGRIFHGRPKNKIQVGKLLHELEAAGLIDLSVQGRRCPGRARRPTSGSTSHNLPNIHYLSQFVRGMRSQTDPKREDPKRREPRTRESATRAREPRARRTPSPLPLPLTRSTKRTRTRRPSTSDPQAQHRMRPQIRIPRPIAAPPSDG